MMLVSKQYDVRIYTACSCEKDVVITSDLMNSIDTTSTPTLTAKTVNRGMYCILYSILKRSSAKPTKAICICRHFSQVCRKSWMVHGLKYLLPFFDELSVCQFPPLFLRFLFLCLSCLPSFRLTFVLR